MKTTPFPRFGRTSEETFSDGNPGYKGVRIHLETVDCEICGRMFVPHLLDLANEEMIGLCTEHLGEFARLYAESAR